MIFAPSVPEWVLHLNFKYIPRLKKIEMKKNYPVENTSNVGKKLSMIFSFRNEEDVLEELITRVRNVLKVEQEKDVIKEYELIFVNDRSDDRSEEILKELNQNHGDIKIINMSRNFGVSPCVLAGLKFATGDVAIYMDADLQDPPELVSKMLEAWGQGDKADVVHTVRTSRAGEPFLKLQLTKLGYWILGKFSDIDLTAEAGDFKLMSRRVINHINKLNEYNPFMRGLVVWVGFNQTKIYYKREKRYAGDTKFPIISRKVLSNFFNSALISFSAAPLQFSTLIGLGGILVSFLMILFVFLVKFYGIIPPGRAALMTAIMFMGSIELLAFGVMGLYVHSVFIMVKRRPNYIIESVFGFTDEELETLREVYKNDIQIF